MPATKNRRNAPVAPVEPTIEELEAAIVNATALVNARKAQEQAVEPESNEPESSELSHTEAREILKRHKVAKVGGRAVPTRGQLRPAMLRRAAKLLSEEQESDDSVETVSEDKGSKREARKAELAKRSAELIRKYRVTPKVITTATHGGWRELQTTLWAHYEKTGSHEFAGVRNIVRSARMAAAEGSDLSAPQVKFLQSVVANAIDRAGFKLNSLTA